MCESALLDLSGDHSVPCVFPRGALLESVGYGNQPFKRGAECPDLSDSGSIVCVPDAERDARASALYIFAWLVGALNYYLLKFRGQPFLATDIFALRTAMSVAGQYTLRSRKSWRLRF